MRKLPLLFYILLFCLSISAQVKSIDDLAELYSSFKFREAIQTADSMINSSDYSTNELVKIHELKGMALFSVGEETNSRIAFDQLLKINPNYTMDPNRISPKIISFFNEIKIAYQNELDQDRPILDSLRIIKQEMLQAQSTYKSAVVKNLILPGWGHFEMGNSTKGLIYSILEVASVAASVAFIIKTNDARSAYQNETNKTLIASKYDEYNSVYKTRNLLLITTTAIWIASQLDILFLADYEKFNGSANSISYKTIPRDLQFSVSIPLN